MRGYVLLARVALRVFKSAVRGAIAAGRDGARRGAQREIDRLAVEIDVLADRLEAATTRYDRRRG